ncbi:hypothetical protein G4D82_09865 [Flavobacterium sp. CYK-4]|uniref:restriction endonuclease n=1 Tax=Flavobacterium lotistagni TaxID=2709660 RepID=UPI00140CB675|nr:restriction endonuclease [Flavobacterium lotistagni]NHM07526.1 hypothetical protein [Flavobacterium lotistagni]
MKVVKHSGISADFDKDKLLVSLRRSGANPEAVSRVLHLIENQLYDGISTKEIYKMAHRLLKKISASHAARYNLRNALLLLGPAGFFFEKFIARLFQHEGYQTQTNLNLKGKCVSHEVDVLIKKHEIVTMIECKFHNSRLNNSDVKVPMYILSRFNDLKDRGFAFFQGKETISRCLIATNNRFTADAIAFANCSGLGLLSWDYPEKFCLKTKIDQQKLYPITCLTTISSIEKEKLLILDTILVLELLENPDRLLQIGISSSRVKNILKEATSLCK